MKLNKVLNMDRVMALQVEPNAYVKSEPPQTNVKTQEISQVIFPQPYDNVSKYYNKNQFSPPPIVEDKPKSQHNCNAPMFDIKSLLPMLMSGKFNDMIKPIMSLLGGSKGGGTGLGDISKIFELIKPKTKDSKPKEEDESSKFDDMIIIED